MTGSTSMVSDIVNREAPDEALSAAQSWLKLTDGNDTMQSWMEASSLFKNAVPQSQWEAGFSGRRVPLGNVVSRKIISTSLEKTQPGAPDGHYLSIKYHTEFTNKKETEESLVLMLDNDGSWRVCGYFFK